MNTDVRTRVVRSRTGAGTRPWLVGAALAAGVVISAMPQVGRWSLQAAGQTAGPADPGLVGLIGLWRAGTEDGRATFTVDGTAGAPAPVAEAATAIFGTAAPQFLAAAGKPGVFPLAAAKAIDTFSSGELRVQFKILAGATDQTAGLAFNIRPDGSYTYARYNTKDGNVAIWKFEAGARTVLQHGDMHEQLPFGVWHALVVSITGRTISATVNDRLRVAHTLDRDIAGRVGFWTKADSVTAFRGLTATRR